MAGMPVKMMLCLTLYFNYLFSCLIQALAQSCCAGCILFPEQKPERGAGLTSTAFRWLLWNCHPQPHHRKNHPCPLPLAPNPVIGPLLQEAPHPKPSGPYSHLPDSMLIMLLDALGWQLPATAQQVSVELQRPLDQLCPR